MTYHQSSLELNAHLNELISSIPATSDPNQAASVALLVAQAKKELAETSEIERRLRRGWWNGRQFETFLAVVIAAALIFSYASTFITPVTDREAKLADLDAKVVAQTQEIKAIKLSQKNVRTKEKLELKEKEMSRLKHGLEMQGVELDERIKQAAVDKVELERLKEQLGQITMLAAESASKLENKAATTITNALDETVKDWVKIGATKELETEIGEAKTDIEDVQAKLAALALTVDRGQLSFDAGGFEEQGPLFSRRVRVPDSTSGAVIGRGYDMRRRTAEQVIKDLSAARIEAAYAQRLSEVAGKVGKEADDFIAKELGDIKISLSQQRALFNLTYKEYEDDVARISKQASEVYGRIDWLVLNPAIRDVLVDLRFADEYTAATQAHIQEAVFNNSLPAFMALMANEKFWLAKIRTKRNDLAGGSNSSGKRLTRQSHLRPKAHGIAAMLEQASTELAAQSIHRKVLCIRLRITSDFRAPTANEFVSASLQ